MLTRQKVEIVATDYDAQGNLVKTVEDIEVDVLPENIKSNIGTNQNPYLLLIQMTVNGITPGNNTKAEIERKMFDYEYSVEKYFTAMSKGKYSFKKAPLTIGTTRVVEMSMTSPDPPSSGMSISEWEVLLQGALETSANASKVDWVKMFPDGNDDRTALSIVVAHSGNSKFGSGNYAIPASLSIGGKVYSCTLITICDSYGDGTPCTIHTFAHELMHGAGLMDLYFSSIWEWFGNYSIMSVAAREYKQDMVGIDPLHALLNDWCTVESVTSFPSTKTLTERGRYLHVQLTESDIFYIIEKRPNDHWDRFNPDKFIVWRLNKVLIPPAFKIRSSQSGYLDSIEKFCHFVCPAGMTNSDVGAVEAGVYGNGTHKLPYLNISISGSSITINKADKDGNISNSRPTLPDPSYEKVLVADVENCIAGNGSLKVKMRLPSNAPSGADVLAYFSKNHFEITGTLSDGYYVFSTSGFSNTLDSVSFRVDGGQVLETPYYEIDLKLGTGGGDITNVTGVTLDKTSHTFTDYTTLQLTPTIAPSNATNKSVSWSTSNMSVATVSSAGLVKAQGNGNCTITCTTADSNKTATCSIVVNSSTGVPVDSVTLNVNSHKFTNNNTLQLIATVQPTNAANKTVVWSSSNNTVATVSSAGLVTPGGDGNCTITCTTVDGNKTATCSVVVDKTVEQPLQYVASNLGTLFVDREVIAPTVPVTGVTIDRTSISLTEGYTTTLSATVLPSNATNKNVTWSSSNNTVATVSATGLVTAKANGSCNITCATIDGNKTANCSIVVTAASGGGGDTGDTKYIATLSRTDIATTTGYPTVPHRSNFNPTSVYMSVNGGDFILKSSYSSDSESSFDVDSLSLSNRTVHTFKLKLNHENGSVITQEGTLYVDMGGTGILPMTSFNVTASKSTISMNEKSKFVVEVLPKGATPVSIGYSTGNAPIINVNEHGEYLGLLPGTATINCTATCGQQKLEQNKTITITQAQQESPVSGNITTTFKDYKAIVSNGSTTRTYDVSYNKHYMWSGSKTLTTSDGDACYLCLHENATSPFIIDGKRPLDGGWNKEPAINIYDGYAGQVNSLSYGMKNVSVPSALMTKALYLINSALPEINLYVDNNSASTIKWEHVSDSYLGACWSYKGRFAIILNSSRLGDPESNMTYSTAVHEIGHTFGFTDQLTHDPTIYSYGRDRNRCIYLQPNDIFSIRLAYGDILSGKAKSLRSDEIEVDVSNDSPLSCKFDFEYFETEQDMLEASDLVVEGMLLNQGAKKLRADFGNAALDYNVYNFKVTKLLKGEYEEDIITVKVHESFDLGLVANTKYKMYLNVYSDSPACLINPEQSIEEVV